MAKHNDLLIIRRDDGLVCAEIDLGGKQFFLDFMEAAKGKEYLSIEGTSSEFAIYTLNKSGERRESDARLAKRAQKPSTGRLLRCECEAFTNKEDSELLELKSFASHRRK